MCKLLLCKFLDKGRKLNHPKYDGSYLKKMINTLLKDTRITDSLNNVVVPAYDIHMMQLVVFTTFMAARDPLMNIKMAGLCIGTTATPTYLPP